MKGYIKLNNHSSIFRLVVLVGALLLINGLTFLYYQNTVNQTGEAYTYPLDDSYIHLAIAKNAAFHNNWGVTQDEFCSASSAPAYTFIISVLMKVFGNNALYPLFLNLIFGNLIIFSFFAYFKNKIWFIVSIFVLVTPVLLHVQILSGMEHTMQIFLVLTAFILFLKLSDNGFSNRKHRILFLCTTALLCLTRYECMFFIIPILIILLLNRQYSLFLLTGAAGFLPVVVFGLWSINHGGFFFPNSLLVKGRIMPGHGFFEIFQYYFQNLYDNVFSVTVILIPVIILFAIVLSDFIIGKTVALNSSSFWDIVKGLVNLIKRHTAIFIVLATVLQHCIFAGIGWLYRYEAYLLVLLFFTLIIQIIQNKITKERFFAVMPIAMLVIIAYFSTKRLYDSHDTMKYAGKNIYDQSIQISRFLNKYYNDEMVMANDIGTITYYANIKLKDLIGLGSVDVLVYKKAAEREGKLGVPGHALISEYKQSYPIVIIYDSWFGINSKDDYEKIGLIKIAEMWIENDRTFQGNHVSFYTSDDTMVDGMKQNMLSFKKEIPDDVSLIVF